jgi:FkbM family methyltransferase
VGLLKSVRRRIEGFGLPRAVSFRAPLAFHGSRKGGWTVCPAALNEESVVYSFGVGKEISFELALIRHYGLRVFAFDPTPEVAHWIASRDLPETFRFFRFGLAGYDGEAAFRPNTNPREVSHTLLDRPETASRAVRLPVRRLSTLARDHGHRRIHLLKLDVEGAEYAALRDLVASDLQVDQLLVEFHHRFRGVGRAPTRDAIQLLHRHGYRVFHVTPGAREYGFLRTP